jgi:hypothetical protein
LKKYNDGINFEMKMMEKASMFPSNKKRRGGRRKKTG